MSSSKADKLSSNIVQSHNSKILIILKQSKGCFCQRIHGCWSLKLRYLDRDLQYCSSHDIFVQYCFKEKSGKLQDFWLLS